MVEAFKSALSLACYVQPAKEEPPAQEESGGDSKRAAPTPRAPSPPLTSNMPQPGNNSSLLGRDGGEKAKRHKAKKDAPAGVATANGGDGGGGEASSVPLSALASAMDKRIFG